MSVELLHPPPDVSPEKALQISQQAPQVLQNDRPFSFPLSLLSADDTPEKWTTYENLYVSCLRTGDDKSARTLLDKLVNRFGDKNERVMAYQAMMAEANAETEQAAIKVLREVGAELEEDPSNLPVQKRRIALLASMNKIQEAISTLTDLVQISPTDAEAWAELSDLYFGQNCYDQAIFCLEEVLLVMPNAWNMHARLAEIIYLSTTSYALERPAEILRGFAEAMRRYCRSIELCNSYLRGYYGLKLTTKRLLELLSNATRSTLASTESAYSDLPLPTTRTVERLHELATAKLGEIVRRSAAGDKGWDGYDAAEIIAARELLDRDEQFVER